MCRDRIIKPLLRQGHQRVAGAIALKVAFDTLSGASQIHAKVRVTYNNQAWYCAESSHLLTSAQV